jgi:hypothetical protein
MFTIATRNARLPVDIRNARRMADIDPRDWSLIERFMVPREPEKPNDLVVLGILGMTCGIVVLGSLVLIYQRFGA